MSIALYKISMKQTTHLQPVGAREKARRGKGKGRGVEAGPYLGVYGIKTPK